jgi:hypothetical protein
MDAVLLIQLEILSHGAVAVKRTLLLGNRTIEDIRKTEELLKRPKEEANKE